MVAGQVRTAAGEEIFTFKDLHDLHVMAVFIGEVKHVFYRKVTTGKNNESKNEKGNGFVGLFFFYGHHFCSIRRDFRDDG